MSRRSLRGGANAPPLHRVSAGGRRALSCCCQHGGRVLGGTTTLPASTSLGRPPEQGTQPPASGGPRGGLPLKRLGRGRGKPGRRSSPTSPGPPSRLRLRKPPPLRGGRRPKPPPLRGGPGRGIKTLAAGHAVHGPERQGPTNRCQNGTRQGSSDGRGCRVRRPGPRRQGESC